MESLQLLFNSLNLTAFFFAEYDYVVYIEHYNDPSAIDENTQICSDWPESYTSQESANLLVPQIYRLPQAI